ncbi:MAG: isocitrate lyase/phosphoenolpyruvate mutase family protein [Anaerolineales bacterium]|nr:MAG: isocitrate lyase/phosphoenolpyruvate mutase family protein [Anaerolineales bacterium]
MKPALNKEEQRRKAERLRELHHGARMLVLPNAWDAASAKVFERAGFKAVATTSAGVANAWGYPDGEVMSRAEMLQAVGIIARATRLPVSADMEAGFGVTPEEIAETARLTLESGAVGINLEDSVIGKPLLTDVSLQVEIIKAVRQAAQDFGVPLVINARTDVYTVLDESDSTRFAQVVERAHAYLEAGADCIFAFGITDKALIGDLVREIGAPVNVLARPGSPTLAELEGLGVARVTFGSIPMRVALSQAVKIADELKRTGTYNFAQGILSYDEVNGYFERMEGDK